ncbi:NADH dehydrogenase [Flavobacterium noncentrifugens]|uniref:NADH:ubiquinone reductase (non-electrogenic) n=1 Tax=Flavobacterium noncentrifugens TaxID=1128970 RepID=A0A1G8WYQ1_9FLAO|nr:NAD(P)/FAD-dependent oxidoreductase [Flavobacterium noncentrifugens]GEP51093.1 NADH dehydrogenase [Flavobacterium noncentrifugens]SDJ83187.1 NADH dehydrogenase [Flavobacterium noncentrifugens]
MENRKHIIVIGAGFAGLKLARELNNHPAYRITFIDKNNFHQFQPLFYQVAVANLDASNISFPLRNIFEKSDNVRIRVQTVTRINCCSKTVETVAGSISYDYLVVATGAATNYFGNDTMEKLTFPMKSTWDALQIRNTLLQRFEDAVLSKTTDVESSLSIIIVGGGATGVELSGALAEMKLDSLPVEYPELDFQKMRIYLIEGSKSLLANMSAASSKMARIYLESMGVTVQTEMHVKQYDGKQVILQDGTAIDSEFVIWTAGVKGNMPEGISENLITKSHQIITDPCNRIMESQDIFAIGDIACMISDDYPRGYPQLASVAIDQAKHLADNFKRLAKAKQSRPFLYKAKGSMATVGRNKAVVDLQRPRWSFQGFFAWLVWMTLHLFLLTGFKNRLVVFINWAYKYMTHRQSLSLLFVGIVRNDKQEPV